MQIVKILFSLYSEKFQTSKEDIDFLKRIEKILTEKECVKNQLYLDVLSILQDLDESYNYEIKLASALFANGYFLKSSNVFKKILQNYDLEENLNARTLLDYANSLRMEKKNILKQLAKQLKRYKLNQIGERLICCKVIFMSQVLNLAVTILSKQLFIGLLLIVL